MTWDPMVVGQTIVTGDAPLETKRFGLTFSRCLVPLDTGPRGFDGVREFIETDDADIIVLRYPAVHVDWFARLLGPKRDLICADSLTYWRLEVGAGDRPSVNRRLAIDRSNFVDAGLINGLVDNIFRGYGSHYLSNPLLAAAKSLAGYREWARSSIIANSVLTLVLEDVGAVGMATLQYSRETCEILLAGIATESQRQGLYSHLLVGCEESARDLGARQLVISTQTHNTNVQRSWSRYGFEPVGTFLTVHAVRNGLLPGSGVCLPA